MKNVVEITISKSVFERLQRLASPLVDTTDSILERLLDCWDTSGTAKVTPSKNSVAEPKLQWKSSRGLLLPVGTELQGHYKKKTFIALVERDGIRFNGKLYGDLSPAAIAAKTLAGATGTAASESGPRFWRFQHPITGVWQRVETLDRSNRIDPDELLAELSKVA